MRQPKTEQYYEGLRDGIRLFAWINCGVLYVGHPHQGILLDKAIQDTFVEQGKETLQKSEYNFYGAVSRAERG